MKRSREQLSRQYDVERELADKIRAASSTERRGLYASVYNEFFTRVPDHPQIVRKKSVTEKRDETERQLGILRPFIENNSVYLEIGAGDCSLAIRIAEDVERVCVLEVSDEISGETSFPSNFELLISDGVEISLPPDSVDIVYSNQLLEHLHADDAVDQLAQVFRALRRGGVYVCITPNRLSGPHDVSRYFDRSPTGFHLREYSNAELIEIFSVAGFRRFRALLSYKRFVVKLLIPLWPILMYEKAIEKMPRALRKLFAFPLGAVKFIGFKE